MLEEIQLSDNARPLLDVDVCLLTENAKYVVVAVRLPKTVVQANHNFLHALSMTSYKPPDKSRKLQTLLGQYRFSVMLATMCAVLILTSLVGEILARAIVHASHPMEILVLKDEMGQEVQFRGIRLK